MELVVHRLRKPCAITRHPNEELRQLDRDEETRERRYAVVEMRQVDQVIFLSVVIRLSRVWHFEVVS